MPQPRNAYAALPDAGMPPMPPSYDNLGASEDRTFEQFEIDDLDYESPAERLGFLKRASNITKKFAAGFSNSVIHPVAKIIDPIYEGLDFMNMQFERWLMKLGNPLVIKRLLYVFFMVGVVVLVSRQEMTEGVTGSSGGTFSSGKLYDIEKLAANIPEHIDVHMMKDNLEYLSSMPHIAGTAGDLALAKYVHQYMKNNGVDLADMPELESFLNYPKRGAPDETYVKLSDGSFEATLNENHKTDMEFLAYNPNALNTNGEIEGDMIYANHGTPEDFAKLKQNNINVKDSILLIRYGGNVPEANKIVIAQDSGAKAIVFISPKLSAGKGDQKTEIDTAIQRINVGLTRYSTGDVLTPGWSSEDGYATRLLWMQSKTTPKIPTIPISHKDGHMFLEKLKNSGVKFDDNHFSGDRKSKIKVKITNEIRPTHKLWNVIGTIPGRDQPDKHIIIGAARDATCYGTMSTNTGTVVLLELIKIMTTLQRHFNWSPARSITFISFDATSYNLAGASEWIEETRETFKARGFTYIDLSDAITGDQLAIKANPFLHRIIRDTLERVKIEGDGPAKNFLDLYKQQNADKSTISNNMIEDKNYLPLINVANIPSAEIKFSGYEYPKDTCSDSFQHFESSDIDPSMKKHKDLVHILSRLVLSLAEEPNIPFAFQEFVDRLVEYEDDLERFIKDQTDRVFGGNKPRLQYAEMHRALNRLRETARVFDDWIHRWKQFIQESAEIEPSLLTMKRWKWNEELIYFNEQFVDKSKVVDRASYRNILFGLAYDAPSEDDGKWQWNTFPTIRDRIQKGDYEAAQNELDKVARLIQFITQQLAMS